jgi:hypothetical protein
MLRLSKHNARDIVPYALSNVLSTQISIWTAYKDDTQNHLIGEHFQPEAHPRALHALLHSASHLNTFSMLEGRLPRPHTLSNPTRHR